MNPDPDAATAEDAGTQAPTLAEAMRSFLDQSLWANREWVEFVYSRPEPEVRPRELLSHIMVGERIWLERIDGPQRTDTFFPLLEKQPLLQGLTENADRCRALIDSCLERVVHFRRAGGEEYHARVADIIQHLLTHGYHHRGQLAAHFAARRLTYPNTDHINYLIVNRL
jgi:uncharacterized damage-inducible protein DinB